MNCFVKSSSHREMRTILGIDNTYRTFLGPLMAFQPCSSSFVTFSIDILELSRWWSSFHKQNHSKISNPSDKKWEEKSNKKGLQLQNKILPPKISVRSSTMLVAEGAFLPLDEAPTGDVFLVPSGPPLFWNLGSGMESWNCRTDRKTLFGRFLKLIFW